VFVFLSLSLFPFIYFPILRLAVGAAAAVQEAWPQRQLSAQEEREQQQKHREEKKKEEEEKKDDSHQTG
jgi:ribosomal protein L12E/L44/L45/RPP1/RPP2